MSTAPPEQYLKTRQVAQALKVSVSTIKRWIDSGALAANRTLGKHRLVSEAELRRFAREQGLRFSLEPAEAFESGGSLLEGGSADPSRMALIQALKNGDALKTRLILQGLHDSGVSAASLGEKYIVPVMKAIGHGWARGEIDVYQEHDATSIISNILTEFNQRLARNLIEPAPSAIGATVEGDPYSLPLQLGELTLRELGWSVRNLGVNLPIDSLVKAIHRYKPRLVFVCMNGESTNALDSFIQQFRWLEETISTLEGSGLRIMIGGRKIPMQLPALVPRIDIGGSMTDLANLANQIAPYSSARSSPWLRVDWKH